MGPALMGGSLLGCLLMGIAPVQGQPALPQDDADSILTPVTREWQTEAVARLKAFRPTVTTPIMWVEDEGGGRLTVSRGPGGILWLGREDWVYLTSFWSHTADPQVVLVIDRKGRIYRNFEHICPSLFLESPNGAELNSLEAFLKTLTSEGPGPHDWQLLDDSAATPDRDALPTAWEHQAEVAGSGEARSDARQLAVLALIREGSAESWEVVEPMLRGSTDWQLLEEAWLATEKADPGRAEVVRGIVNASLSTEPQERARRLAAAMLTVDTQESLTYLLSFTGGADPVVLRAALEGAAEAQDGEKTRRSRPFGALRNSVAVLATLDRERAAAFYRSLLDFPDQHVRQAGVYGVGELRLADTVEKLVTLVDRDTENYFVPSSVCIAFGKLGTPEAHDALIELLLQEPIHVKQSWAVLCVMTEVCGEAGGSPRGSWLNGCWATVAEDKPAAARRFAEAMNQLAERTTDERLAREARGRASFILSRTR